MIIYTGKAFCAEYIPNWNVPSILMNTKLFITRWFSANVHTIAKVHCQFYNLDNNSELVSIGISQLCDQQVQRSSLFNGIELEVSSSFFHSTSFYTCIDSYCLVMESWGSRARKTCRCYTGMTLLAVWHSGNDTGHINKVALHHDQLVLSGFNTWSRTSISVCNQPPRSTQPGHPSVGRRNEYKHLKTQVSWSLDINMAMHRRPSIM